MWPLLLSEVHGDDPIKSDADYDKITAVEGHYGPSILAQWWEELLGDGEPQEIVEMVRTNRLDTVGVLWPGIANPPSTAAGERQRCAAQIADSLLEHDAHLALVPAADGAHALTAIGWTGPLNHDNDTAKFSAVIRDWQQRFGATVVGLSFDTLTLSVAAPP